MNVMGRAESLLSPRGPVEVDRSKMPTADQVRKSVRRDAKRLLEPFFKKVQQQRGLPTDGGRIGGPDDLYCHPKPGSWIESF